MRSIKKHDYRIMLENNYTDHKIVFVTLTFKDIYNSHDVDKLPYDKSFENLMRYLNYRVINQKYSKLIKQSIKLIVFREYSKKSSSETKFTPYHFHGFLLIPDSLFERFYKRIDDFSGFCKNYFRDQEKRNRDKILKIDEIDFKFIGSLEILRHKFYYSTKHLRNRDFSGHENSKCLIYADKR